ncbi:ABC transporter substrate-binding protein [Paenibacillus typhae]|uniref:DNA-binding transcriptional regulator SgrR of sgrS sRNA, contains a MarR-type HTH domain and a solute-binding domain n=1 Tax=Paenibacillus typhae TaxID=1174501 RepID=A0A1G9B4Q1_9BACL|nr:ABC transporter substrate-binding protein [Paenibacillus typhae]SDK34084.1 DNA-binding transcriptional regulator SgrR of sgrS sRNA, contains a MarR-type HTH domain and a solute-binding domain [Paenibacillus typhae]
MKLHSQFLRLHSMHGGAEEASVTLDELAHTLGCTHRNTLHVIKKLAEQGWVCWTPSRGRGRRSSLRFLADAEEIALSSMMQAISSSEIRSAIDGIRGHARSSSLQDTLQGWLLAYFGYHSELRSDKRIDTLRLPVRQQLHNLDPLYMNLLAESFVSSHVFDGLVARSGGQDRIIPALAHTWDTSEQRTVWTFHLRKDVLFHHGKVLAAEDVVYSFKRMMDSSQRLLYSNIFRDIREVKALNPGTVRFLLKQPNELFLPFLCTSRAAIVPRDLETAFAGSFGRRPAGTGPFKLVEMNEDLCTLEVFPYYFQGRAHLDRVEILHVPWDISAAESETGSAFHIVHNPSSGGPAAWSRIHSEYSVRKFVTCNTKKKGPLSDPLIRAEVLSCLGGGLTSAGDNAAGRQQSEAAPAIESGSAGVADDTVGLDGVDNTAESKTSAKIMACASAPALQIATIPQYAGDAEAVAAKLTGCGYACHVLSVSPEEFKGPVRLQADLILFSLLRDQDEQLRLSDLYSTMVQHLEPQIRADIEGRLQIIAREPDSKTRAAGFQQIEDSLRQKHQLHILYEKPAETAYLPSVRGVTFNSQGWVDLRHLWFPPEL